MKRFLIGFGLVITLLVPVMPVLAQEMQPNPFNTDLVGEVGGTIPAEYRSSVSNPVLIVVKVIRILLSFVGIGLVGLLVYAGFMWMTSAGNDDQVSTAKSTIKNAVIGLIVIMMAWTLSTFIIQRIQVATRSYGRGGLLQDIGGSVIDAVDDGISGQFR